MTKTVKKLRSAAGMTLTEVLVCVAILAILFATIVVGANTAAKTYRRSVNYALSQTLTSTVYNAVANELRYATNIREEDGDVLFDSEAFGTGVSVRNNEENTRVLIGTDAKSYELLSDSAYTGGLAASVEIRSYLDGIVTMTITVSGPEIETSTTELSLRALNAK